MKNRKGLGTSRAMAVMVIFAITSMSLAYAGDTASDTLGATLTLGNTAPQITSVLVQAASYSPTAGTTTAIAVRMNVSDANGYADVDLTNPGTLCNVTKGADKATLSTCVKTEDISSTEAEYECTGDMQYYYATGADWTVTCKAYDLTGGADDDSSQTLTYNRLEQVNVVATSISWTGVSMASTDVGAYDDPIVTANLGNAYFAKLNMTAADLDGDITPTDIIVAEDFSANDADAANGETLADGTPVTITDAVLTFGAGANENVYAYLEQITTAVSVQSYASTSPWEVEVYQAANSNP